jgi:hypothetical protein
MIKYTSIAPIRLEAFGDNFEPIFNGADNLVYVAIRHSALIPNYTYRLRLYVDEIPIINDPIVRGFVTYATRPSVVTLDTGNPILGTWYALNETNTYTILNIILGHKV